MWILTLDIHDVKLSLWRRTRMALLVLVLRYLVLPWQTSSKGEFRSDKACLDTISRCSFYDACVCVCLIFLLTACFQRHHPTVSIIFVLFNINCEGRASLYLLV